MSSWLSRLFRRNKLTDAEWMNRARLAFLAEVPAIQRPRISMVADHKRILFYIHLNSGTETIFEFQQASNPEDVVKTKVKPWVMKQQTKEQPL